MKRNIFILATVLSLLAFSACKDENKVTILETPIASALGTLPSFSNFTMDNSDNELIFSWSAANLGFTDFGIDHAMQFRLVTIVDAAEPIILYSDPVDFTIATFATVFPPIYATGSALGGWDWGSGHDIELRSSEPGVYNTIAYFSNVAGNNTFRFFAQAGWGAGWNYPAFTTVDSKLENALDGDLNFRMASGTATGYYSITVNQITSTVTMTSVPEPLMYMTGAGVGGWDWTGSQVQMTWISNGIFEATTDFIQGAAFRFFAQADWGPTSYNYPYFAGGTVSALLSNANDGDSNFNVVGATGTYTIRINLLDNIVSMTPVNP